MNIPQNITPNTAAIISSSFNPRITRKPTGSADKLWTVEGVGEGAIVGTVDGDFVDVGRMVGDALGSAVGLVVEVGHIVGDALGTAVGLVVEVGGLDGEEVGTVEGLLVGLAVGNVDG